LGQESQALGQAIYEATQAAQAQGAAASDAAGAQPGGGASSPDDVVDAEVVDDDRESK
ncbi:MAG: molecular chaperone DnaK, partial [Mycobacterium sp.]|nr:molecular chaperone DnaK [Mycobacterium sp.]